MAGSFSRTTAFHPAMRLNTRAIMPAETSSRVLGNAGAIASSRTGNPSIGEFEDAPNRPQTRSGSLSQMGQKRRFDSRPITSGLPP